MSDTTGGRKVGVDASRIRSGGGIAHIRGLLGHADPRDYGICAVHLWAHDALLKAIEPQPWLIKHEVAASRKSILHQLAWQRFQLPREAKTLGIEVMFNADAGSVCSFRPAVTLSQDMLSFEPGEIERYPWPSRARLRLEILRFVQLRSLKRSTVALFLTDHARRVIGRLTTLAETQVIPHGIDQKFFGAADNRREFPGEGPIRCLYVSNVAPYKHQWNVVEAIAMLRARSGRDIRLSLVGGGHGRAMEQLEATLARHDPDRQFVELGAFVPNDQIVDVLRQSDVFVFASSCENLPITLLEAMASGIPIASSDRGPMPETLGPDGSYFDPEDPSSIALAVDKLISAQIHSDSSAGTAVKRASTFTWKRTAQESWRLLASIAER